MNINKELMYFYTERLNLEDFVYLFKHFRITLFNFKMVTSCLFIQVADSLTDIEKESGLLLALAVLKESAPAAQ